MMHPHAAGTARHQRAMISSRPHHDGAYDDAASRNKNKCCYLWFMMIMHDSWFYNNMLILITPTDIGRSGTSSKQLLVRSP